MTGETSLTFSPSLYPLGSHQVSHWVKLESFHFLRTYCYYLVKWVYSSHHCVLGYCFSHLFLTPVFLCFYILFTSTRVIFMFSVIYLITSFLLKIPLWPLIVWIKPVILSLPCKATHLSYHSSSVPQSPLYLLLNYY